MRLKGWCEQSSAQYLFPPCHAWLRLLQSQPQCSSTCSRNTTTQSHKYRHNDRRSYIRWRSCHSSRYKSYIGTYSSRQGASPLLIELCFALTRPCLRIARNCTTSLPKYGAPVQGQLQTRNLPLPSSHQTSNSTLYQLAANPASLHV